MGEDQPTVRVRIGYDPDKTKVGTWQDVSPAEAKRLIREGRAQDEATVKAADAKAKAAADATGGKADLMAAARASRRGGLPPITPAGGAG